jgi:ribonuclease P protein component
MTAQRPPGVDDLRAPAAPARLKKRADFLAAAKGRRASVRPFTLQAGRRGQGCEGEPARFGLTVTKKTGNSVERNRMRRRLREALRLTPDLPARAGHDYVVVARRELLAEQFPAIGRQLVACLEKVHAPRPPRGGKA